MVSLRHGLEAEAGAAAEEAPVGNEALDEPKQLNEGVLRVLQGHLDHLPTMNSKIVRIFTSSTFTGEKNLVLNCENSPLERNRGLLTEAVFLVKQAFPLTRRRKSLNNPVRVCFLLCYLHRQAQLKAENYSVCFRSAVLTHSTSC